MNQWLSQYYLMLDHIQNKDDIVETNKLNSPTYVQSSNVYLNYNISFWYPNSRSWEVIENPKQN